MSWGVLLALLGSPESGRAIDGVLRYQGTNHEARADGGTIETYTRRGVVTADQRLKLSSSLLLSTRIFASREIAGRGGDDGDQRSEIRSTQPAVTLRYGSGSIAVGATTSWLERVRSGSASARPREDRSNLESWFNWRGDSDRRLGVTFSRVDSRADEPLGESLRQIQKFGTLGYDQPVGKDWRGRYRFSGLSGDLTTRQERRSHWSHGLEFLGSPQIEKASVTTRFRVRSNVNGERTESGPDTRAMPNRLPLAGGVLLDDTPDTHDPLEDDLGAESALYDRNREDPTRIDLGDDAPAVREIGGDYRNIQYDFGETVEFASAVLFIDRRILHPEVFDWRAWVTDDPDGRLWTEVDPGAYTVSYDEWGVGLQGWRATFREGTSGRHFKLVNEKLGKSVPRLYVTEMEVSERTGDGPDVTSRRASAMQFDSNLTWQAHPDFQMGYETLLRKRWTEGNRGDVSSQNHAISSRYTWDEFRAHGRMEMSIVANDEGRSTDLMNYMAGVRHQSSDTHSWNTGWSRAEDRSGARGRTTDSFSLRSDWKPLPLLGLTQAGSHSRRDDRAAGTRSRSWAFSQSLKASPWRSLSMTLDHRNRWVDRAAGSGFERLHDSGGRVYWQPMPTISLSGDGRYEKRRTDSWSSRGSASWSPFPTGSVETSLSGSIFYDSRTEVTRLGGTARFEARPRTGLRVEGTFSAQRYEIAGQVSSPLSTTFNIGYTF